MLCILPRVLVPQYDVISVNKLSLKHSKSLVELVVHLLISHQTTSIQSTINYIKHLSSKLFYISTEFSPESKRVKFHQSQCQKCLKYQRVSKSFQKCPSLAWVLLFTSMVMPSIIMEVIHMYVSIAMELSTNLLDFHIHIVVSIKVNVNLTMCNFPAL